MAKRLWKYYSASFDGLGISSWFLAAIAFVNRAGTMVVPFLGLYLVKSLGLSPQDVSWIMMAFGFGSIFGSIVGGKLVQRWKALPVLGISLLLSGLAFVFVAQIRNYAGLMVGVFVVGVVGDAFRPAAMVAITETVGPLLRKRALALLRMAVNAGMAIGPAVGGALATINYQLLFIGDAVACWLAALILLLGYRSILCRHPESIGDAYPNSASISDFETGPSKNINEKSELRTQKNSGGQENPDGRKSPCGQKILGVAGRPSKVWELPPQRGSEAHVDRFMLAVLIIAFLTGICFFQVVATKPLFLHEFYGLSEASIGTMFSINGALIVPLEMVLFHTFEAKNPLRVYAFGSILIGIALAILPFGTDVGFGFFVFSVLLWTFGEMLTMPFANSIMLTIAPEGKIGLYMGWYSATFSAAFLVAPIVGLQLYAYAGWTSLWISVGVVSAGVAGISLLLAPRLGSS